MKTRTQTFSGSNINKRLGLQVNSSSQNISSQSSAWCNKCKTVLGEGSCKWCKKVREINTRSSNLTSQRAEQLLISPSLLPKQSSVTPPVQEGFLWRKHKRWVALVCLFLVTVLIAIVLSQPNISFNPFLRSSSNTDSSQIMPSEVGADYTKLQSLLAAKKFREADEETRKLMFWITNQNEEKSLDQEEIVKKIPCTDLSSIDSLWSKNSKDKFGFSAQYRIFLKNYNKYFKSQNNVEKEHKIQKTETFNAFGEEVGWKGRLGWKSKEDLTYDLRSPQGHLPAKVFLWCRKDLFSEYCSPLIIEINGKYFSDNSLKVVSVMQRFQDCKLSKETLPLS